MTPYFAYGSNMDGAALRSRCPNARTIGVARLARHRFDLMGNGYATVRRAAGAGVHGVLYELAASDIAPLDLYEDVDGGLYNKGTVVVRRPDGATVTALIYFGGDPATGRSIHPGYMEGVVAAARAAGLTSAYVAFLARLAEGAS